jgi:hypothetical protein
MSEYTFDYKSILIFFCLYKIIVRKELNMGYQVEARCGSCGSSFTAECEGGMFYHLVRCDACGKIRHIAFAELGLLHLRYLKGMPRPYGVKIEEREIEPISEDEYYSAVEATAGTCVCGGNYCLDAPLRCPACGSERIEEGKIVEVFD